MGVGVPLTISVNSFFVMELMSSGESPGTAGKLLRFGGGRFGGGVVPLASLKLEKSSTIISVVVDDVSSFDDVDDDGTEDFCVVEGVLVVVVVVSIVVVAAVVDMILILGRFFTPLAPVTSLGRPSDT